MLSGGKGQRLAMYARLEVRRVPPSTERTFVTLEGEAALLDYVLRATELNSGHVFFERTMMLRQQHKMRGRLDRNHGTEKFPLYRLFGVLHDAGYGLLTTAITDSYEVHTFLGPSIPPRVTTPQKNAESADDSNSGNQGESTAGTAAADAGNNS